MNLQAASLVWLIAGLLLANLPFLTDRRFGLLRGSPKPFAFRLLEWLVAYGLTLGIGWGLESSVSSVVAQTWNFYAMTLLLFVVMAYPGFVWCQLRRRRSRT